MSVRELDNAHVPDYQPIDSIAIANSLLEFTGSSKLFINNKMLPIDHRAHMIDINIGDYLKSRQVNRNL